MYVADSRQVCVVSTTTCCFAHVISQTSVKVAVTAAQGSYFAFTGHFIGLEVAVCYFVCVNAKWVLKYHFQCLTVHTRVRHLASVEVVLCCFVCIRCQTGVEVIVCYFL